MPFLNIFDKTVNLCFNGLTGINSLCSIYFTKDAKKKQFQQIDLRTVKLPYLIEIGNLNNFNIHSWVSKSDMFLVIAVANSLLLVVCRGLLTGYRYFVPGGDKLWLGMFFMVLLSLFQCAQTTAGDFLACISDARFSST